MDNKLFLTELKHRLEVNLWPLVVQSLRQDALIWETLQDTVPGGLRERALARKDGKGSWRAEDWSPAALALLALGLETTLDNLLLQPMKALSEADMARLEQAEKDLPRSPLSLARAGLQALVLRERRRASGSWENLSEILLSTPRAVLACLYGMLPNPIEFLRALIETHSARGRQAAQRAVDLGLHAVLANPQTQQKRIEAVAVILEALPASGRLEALRRLQAGSPSLAASAAHHLLENIPGVEQAAGPKPLQACKSVEQLLEQAELWRLAEEPEEIAPLLEASVQAARRLQGELMAQLARSASLRGESEIAVTTWEKAAALDPQAIKHRAGRILVLLDAGRMREAAERLEAEAGSENHPLLLLAKARLHTSRLKPFYDPESARTSARLALKLAVEYQDQESGPAIGGESGIQAGQASQFEARDEFFLQLAALLLSLGQAQEAVQAAKFALAASPNRPEHLAFLSRAQRAAGDLSSALESAFLAAAAGPERPEYRRLLVEALEANGLWGEALSERMRLIDACPAPEHGELRALAGCAIQAGQPELAIQACDEALEIIAAQNEDPSRNEEDSGLIYALLGEAQAALGENDQALESLGQATQLAPHLAAPWLVMARVQKLMEQCQQALETLRYATRAAPDSAEVYLALGEAYLEADSPTQALSALRSAADLASASAFASSEGTLSLAGQVVQAARVLAGPQAASYNLNGQISLRLGQTLHQLGHLPEARQALEEAYRLSPSDPTRAYAYAQILQTLGELRLAITPLETVVQTNPQSALPYLDYARCLLRLSADAEPAAGPALENGAGQARLRVEVGERSGKAGTDGRQPHAIIPVERAQGLIRKALELEPENSESKALLAEALAAGGNLEEALSAFRAALDTDLVQDQTWKVRLTYGLGRAALRLGQVETAIAALQEAAQLDPLDAKIQCALAEAFEVLGFYEDAYAAARAALLLAPADLRALTWFAHMAMALSRKAGGPLAQAQAEAVKALESAAQLAPDRTDLRVQLGHIQMQIGDRMAARSAYSGVVEADQRNPEENGSAQDLYQAGCGLLELGDPAGAAKCLERALQAKPDAGRPASEPALLEMLNSLAAARYLAGDTQDALDALDQATALAPTEAGIYLNKIDLLVESGKQEQALECLEQALTMNAGNPALEQRAALLYRAAANLPAALAHARRLNDPQPEPAAQAPGLDPASAQAAPGQGSALLSPIGVLALIGDLEHALLLSDSARFSLERPASLEQDGEPAPAEDLFDYYALLAELAIEAGDPAAAAASLSNVLEMDPGHPRLLALQARITIRQAQMDETERFRLAQQTLNRALEGLNSGDYLAARLQERTPRGSLRGCGLLTERVRALNTRMAIAEAALDLHHWETALQIIQGAIHAAEQEPYLHLAQARCLVLRAEYQQLCTDLDAVRHAPGEAVLSESVYQSVTEALDTVRKLLSQVEDSQVSAGMFLLKRWTARAAAIFHPGAENAQALSDFNNLPDDVASRVFCLGRSGDLSAAGVAARSYPNHPLVLAQLALALAKEKPRQALAAAHAAAESVHRPGPAFRPERQPACLVEIRPLIHALLARMLHFNGGRAGDETLARQSILDALEIWPDEPGWHILAAEIYLSQGHPDEVYDPASAIAHLEQAIKLDPEMVAPYLLLGQVYLMEGTSIAAKRAVHILEGATRLAPGEYEAWLALSQAYRMASDLEGAAACAEKAVELGPDLIEPLLLRGEIALQANNPRGAQSRAQAALKLDPNDPAALVLLSRSFNAQDRPSEALSVLEKALPLAEKPLPLLLERARLLKRSSGPEAALQALHEITERYPDEPEALARLAEALDSAGQSEQALLTAQRALRAGFGSITTASSEGQAEIHFLLGRLLRRAGQLDQAVHHLNEALRSNPEWLEVYLELGHTHEERRQYPQAVKSYQKAIAIDPASAQAYYLAGQALKESKDYVNAEAMLRRAAELSPNDASVHRLLAAVVALNLVHNRRQASINA